MKLVEERTKQVYGMAFASFISLVTLFQSHASEELAEYKRALVEKCATAVQNVAVQVNVNKFFLDMVGAYKNGVFGYSRGELENYFKVTKRVVDHPPCAPNQGSWKNYFLYINYNPLTAKMKEYLGRQKEVFPLNPNDLRDQLSQLASWVPAKNSRQGHRQRFGKGEGTSPCWCIDVDKHALGYQPNSDEDLARAHFDAGTGNALEFLDRSDPRKGELFDIINALEKVES
jgi:hypothetical protein